MHVDNILCGMRTVVSDCNDLGDVLLAISFTVFALRAGNSAGGVAASSGLCFRLGVWEATM